MCFKAHPKFTSYENKRPSFTGTMKKHVCLKLPACCFLHSFVFIEHSFQQFCHQLLQVLLMWLTDHPMRVSTQSPARD